MRGTPYIVRIVAAGLRKPKVISLGTAVDRQVEAVGWKVTQFQPGDAVFGNRSLLAGRGVLAPNGICVAAGGKCGRWRMVSCGGSERWPCPRSEPGSWLVFPARPNKADLTVSARLMEERKVTPLIDRRYRLSEVPEAIRYLEEGHAQGKVVISLD